MFKIDEIFDTKNWYQNCSQKNDTKNWLKYLIAKKNDTKNWWNEKRIFVISLIKMIKIRFETLRFGIVDTHTEMWFRLNGDFERRWPN